MRSVTSLDRVAGCGQAAVGGYVPIHFADGVASYGGIITCESVWACAVCSASIRQRRAQLVEQRAAKWLEAGHGLAFATLTIPHTTDDDLDALLLLSSKAWRRAQQSRAWRQASAALGFVGAVRAVEITHGYNGWHPHAHLLLWFESPLTGRQAVALKAVLYRAWRDAVMALDGREPSEQHGVDVQRVRGGSDALAKYLVKVQDGYDEAKWSAAAEMTRGDLKKARSRHSGPFDIAERAAAGDEGARALWRRYETATKGRRCLEWSRTLTRRLAGDGLDVEPEERKCVVVAEISNHEWNVLRQRGGALRLLVAIEQQGPHVVSEHLRAAFFRYRWDRDRARPPTAA
jgi:hypothetical protein